MGEPPLKTGSHCEKWAFDLMLFIKRNVNYGRTRVREELGVSQRGPKSVSPPLKMKILKSDP